MVSPRTLADRVATGFCRRPFVLLAGTTIVLLLLVVGSIALLYAVGSTALPSTLTGAVAGGAKRE